MAQGVMDVYVSKDQNEHSIILVTNCGYGLPNDLHLIQNGTNVTLKRGDIEKNVVAAHELGAECAFNYIEIDPKTAKQFGLKDGHRVLLNYDSSGSKELHLVRVNKSQASGLVLPHTRKNRDSLVIGYSLLSLLGVPNTPGAILTIKRGAVSHKLKLFIPSNELDSDLHLSPLNLRRFGIQPGKSYLLEYDQTSKTLSFLTSQSLAAKSSSSSKAVIPLRMKTRPAKPAKAQAIGKLRTATALKSRKAQEASKKLSRVKLAKALSIWGKRNNRGRF